MQEADDPERGTGKASPDNTDQAYRDAAQPVKPAFDQVDEYGGIGVTYDKPVDDKSDEAMDDSPDQHDPAVRFLVVGGGPFKVFYLVAMIAPDWVKEDIEASTGGGCLDDIAMDDPPEAGMWMFLGKAVVKGTDYDIQVAYEGEYIRPQFHETIAFGTSWVPIQERLASPLPIGESVPV